VTRYDQVLSTIDKLYEAATRPDFWTSAIRAVTEVSGAHHAVCFIQDTKRDLLAFGVTTNVDHEHCRRYEEVHAGEFRQMMQKAGQHGIYKASDAVIKRDELMRTPVYNELLRPMGVHYSMGSAERLGNRTMAFAQLSRPEHAGDFDAEDGQVIEWLLPHLNRALQLHLRLSAESVRTGAMAEAVDRLAVGVILVDELGHVVQHNRRAGEIIAEADGLSLGPNGPVASNPVETTRLRQLIADAVSKGGGKGTGSGGYMSITRPSMLRPYSVLVSPLRVQPFWETGGRVPYAAIFVNDPEAGEAGDCQALQRLFRLTPREAEVAITVSRGVGLQASADELGVSLTTVRTHLQRVFEKTDTRRQSDLVRLIGTSLGQVRMD
jgi:DNA-binding CsgD family transcriptional regulator/PAS domain-containing protein